MDQRINRFNVAAALGLLVSCALACSGAPNQPGSSAGGRASSNAGGSGSAVSQDGGHSDGGATSVGSGATTGQAGNDAAARVDITSAILENHDVTLGGDSVIKLPPGTTT